MSILISTSRQVIKIKLIVMAIMLILLPILATLGYGVMVRSRLSATLQKLTKAVPTSWSLQSTRRSPLFDAGWITATATATYVGSPSVDDFMSVLTNAGADILGCEDLQIIQCRAQLDKRAVSISSEGNTITLGVRDSDP